MIQSRMDKDAVKKSLDDFTMVRRKTHFSIPGIIDKDEIANLKKDKSFVYPIYRSNNLGIDNPIHQNYGTTPRLLKNDNNFNEIADKLNENGNNFNKMEDKFNENNNNYSEKHNNNDGPEINSETKSTEYEDLIAIEAKNDIEYLYNIYKENNFDSVLTPDQEIELLKVLRKQTELINNIKRTKNKSKGKDKTGKGSKSKKKKESKATKEKENKKEKKKDSKKEKTATAKKKSKDIKDPKKKETKKTKKKDSKATKPKEKDKKNDGKKVKNNETSNKKKGKNSKGDKKKETKATKEKDIKPKKKDGKKGTKTKFTKNSATKPKATKTSATKAKATKTSATKSKATSKKSTTTKKTPKPTTTNTAVKSTPKKLRPDKDFDELLAEFEKKSNLAKKLPNYTTFTFETTTQTTKPTTTTTTTKTKLSTVLTILNEVEVRSALRNNPFVKRILQMANRKRQKYLKESLIKIVN